VFDHGFCGDKVISIEWTGLKATDDTVCHALVHSQIYDFSDVPNNGPSHIDFLDHASAFRCTIVPKLLRLKRRILGSIEEVELSLLDLMD
jgi:hypothetical protein